MDCSIAALWTRPLAAQNRPQDACARPPIGSVVDEPADLRSKNGALEIKMIARNIKESDDRTRYCFTDGEGRESPNLRVSPGDLVIIHLTNAMRESDAGNKGRAHVHSSDHPCTSGEMNPLSTNLPFHGLTIPPTCHEDDVLKTSVQPGDASFEYRFRIPQDEPPGLYWYHPHIHGFSKPQVLGGASGALIVEGIERINSELAGLPERVIIIRDEDLTNPNAPPSKSEPVVPHFLLDRDGDAANNGTGFGKPAKDLTINYILVPYLNYPPPVIRMKPGERQLWRVLNASAITYLNLEVLFNGKPQPLGLVAIDGAPIGEYARGQSINLQTHFRNSARSACGIHLAGPGQGRDCPPGDTDSGHGARWRE